MNKNELKKKLFEANEMIEKLEQLLIRFKERDHEMTLSLVDTIRNHRLKLEEIFANEIIEIEGEYDVKEILDVEVH